MSPTIRLLWRSRLRGSFRRAVALALIAACAVGVCLGVAAGARRTENAYDHVLTLTNGGELGSSYLTGDPNDVDGAADLLDALPAVADHSQMVGFLIALTESPIIGLVSFAIYNDPVVVERPILSAGRWPVAANEVFVNEWAAAQGQLSIGDRLDALVANIDFSKTSPETLEVVGIGILSEEIYEDESSGKPVFILAKDFVTAHPGMAAWSAAIVKLKPDVVRAEALDQMLERGIAIDDDRNLDRARAYDAIRPLVITLWALALLASLATIVVVGQALHRLVRHSPAEQRGLSAIGVTRPMRLMADVSVAATVALAGVVGAIGAAIAVSPLFPLGRARRVSALRGVDVDAATLGLGALASLGALTAMVALLASKRGPSGESRPGTAAGVLGSTPAISTGVRFATGRRGLFATVATMAVGLTSIVAAVVFTQSMNDLVSRPELAGFTWDLVGREAYAEIDTAAVAAEVRDVPGLARVTGLTYVDAVVDGTPIPVSVWSAIEGSPWPPIVAGRAPQAPDEILISPATLRLLGYAIGDSVLVEFPASLDLQSAEVDMTIVGTAVSPAIGLPGSDTPRLDEGLLVSRDDISGRVSEYGGAVLFDLDPGFDTATVVARFPDSLPDDFGLATEWIESAQPAEVIQTEVAIDVLVLAVAALSIGMMAAVANNLLAFVRERRNAFAVLKAIGFTPRQIRATVMWQSGSVLALALVAAVPLGIISGRWMYRRFADGIGVIVAPAAPIGALIAVVLGTVVLVQGVALVPAYHARRTRPAAELRSE